MYTVSEKLGDKSSNLESFNLIGELSSSKEKKN